MKPPVALSASRGTRRGRSRVTSQARSSPLAIAGSCMRHHCRRHNRETFMFARLLILFYAIVSYAVFFVSFLYSLGFVGNYLVPKSIDVGRHTNSSEAIVVDLLLLGIFAIQHSIMARPAFKQWWAKIFPVACQRSTYVLLSGLILLLLFWQWRPIPIPVWQIDGIAAWLLIGVYWLRGSSHRCPPFLV